MEWRMIFRRSPSRWMTLVGDTSQTGSPAGVDEWAETLEPFVGERFRQHGLTVNYRTPRPITELANQLLERINPEATPSVAVRDGVDIIWRDSEKSADTVQDTPGTFTDADGRLHAVITADNVEEIKGLEFDHVKVVHPDDIVAASPQGVHNLYVAITRATQSLTISGRYSKVFR